MKTAISVPDDLFQDAEEFARRRRLSRSALYTAALRAFVGKHRPSDITRALNEVYANHASDLDESMKGMQSQSLAEEKW